MTLLLGAGSLTQFVDTLVYAALGGAFSVLWQLFSLIKKDKIEQFVSDLLLILSFCALFFTVACFRSRCDIKYWQILACVIGFFGVCTLKRLIFKKKV